MAKKKAKKKAEPKFPHERNLEELADGLVEMIEEEGFDTYVREGLYGVIERLRELSETHKPDILRDIRDLGWVVVNHRDVIDRPGSQHERPPVKWMFHKRNSAFDCDGLVVEAAGPRDEEALWQAASKIARHELPSEKAVKYANDLLKKGKSYGQAIVAARKKFAKKRAK